MLYFIFEDLSAGFQLSALPIFILVYIVVKTFIALGLTIFSLIKTIKHKKIVLETILLLAFWIGWIALIIIDVEIASNRGIGRGFSPWGPLDPLIEPLIFLWPFLIPFFVYSLLAPWVLLTVVIFKFFKKRKDYTVKMNVKQKISKYGSKGLEGDEC